MLRATPRGRRLITLVAPPAAHFAPNRRIRMSELLKTRHHVAEAVRFSPTEIKSAMTEVEGFNAKLAVLITQGVGTMACAYLFALLALISLPDAINNGKAALISWIAQTFLQLVLLAVIMVGQRVQSTASDSRAEKQFNDTEAILDALSLKTEGGLKAVLDAVERRAGESVHA
jgi:hypothetical protein